MTPSSGNPPRDPWRSRPRHTTPAVGNDADSRGHMALPVQHRPRRELARVDGDPDLLGGVHEVIGDAGPDLLQCQEVPAVPRAEVPRLGRMRVRVATPANRDAPREDGLRLSTTAAGWPGVEESHRLLVGTEDH